ncbi:S9 family peptidase [Conyzicola nivalis]|uniref:Oligopeptidase B n=1 Tax=Conyzicola nivalis TaxID=1477021 RepID=A0A916SDC2_9MICO|nr:S9 family peptidase [Conyzicola nivalis]GGA95524.1 oligopeptidase B [Conyzicola nivalis]
MSSQPPIARKIPSERIHHGDVFVDNYEWMRDKQNPEVVAHLEAENAYADAQTDDLALLREQLFEEIKNRTQETDLSVPVREGGWWYYTRTVEGKQYGIHCRAPIADADDWTPPAVDQITGEQVLLDDNVEAEGLEFYSLGSFDVTGDGATLLYAVDTEGDERYTLRLRDLATGDNLADEIEGTAGGAVFDATGRYVFYTTVDDAWRPDTVWRHEIGTAADSDVSVFHEPDERYWVGVGLTRSRRYLEIELGSKITSEALLLDAADPTGEFAVVWPRREGIEYSIEHAVIDGDDRLLIVHNHGAVDFQVTDVSATDPQGPARTLVPHRAGTRIESIDAFAGHLVLEYRLEALPRVAVLRLDRPDEGFAEIPFSEELFTVAAGGNPDWDQPVVRLHYGSFVTPATVNDYDVSSGELRLLKQQAVLGGHDPALYVQRRDWATASDGTRIPISLVYRGDLVTGDEPAPLHLYGYGSYEHSIDAGFAISRLSLLDRGVIFAVAHVRGGGELGRDWYENGKTLTKRNTFTDFVAVAQHLTDTGITSADRLVAEGGSAGGLLMGAVANLAPDAFAGILAVVPFVDPLTSILDPSLPLSVIEWDEWGDPLHDADVYRLMKSYSPYENVREMRYPRILAVTSINDTRVLYVEPAKWVARLREVGASVILKTEMSAGHGGVSGRYESWRKRAFELAWVLDVLGLHNTRP